MDRTGRGFQHFLNQWLTTARRIYRCVSSHSNRRLLTSAHSCSNLRVIRSLPPVFDKQLMSSSLNRKRRRANKHRRGSTVTVVAGIIVGIAAIALVGYLLRPTWKYPQNTGPDRIPVSVGETLFNVPANAFRRTVQRHSGPQESVDLQFEYPSLTAPEAQKSVNAETFDPNRLVIDRMLITISAHRDAMSPDVRLATIYPRYLNEAMASQTDGLTTRPFRDGSPYEQEDLFVATEPPLVARCTRSGDTPAICLSEHRVGGADMIFRFPQLWLKDWRGVANAIDQLKTRLNHGRY